MCCAEEKPNETTEVAGWRAWYKGMVRYNSGEVSWADLPDDGLLGAVVYFRKGDRKERRIMTGCDWYFYSPADESYFDNNAPPESNLLRYPGCILKRGQWTNETEMRQVDQEAAGAGAAP